MTRAHNYIFNLCPSLTAIVTHFSGRGFRSRSEFSRPRSAKVHSGHGGWRNAVDEPTHDSGLGFHVAALDVSRLPPEERIQFTWQWQESGAWYSRYYQVAAKSANET